MLNAAMNALNNVEDMNFSRPKLKMDENEFVEIHKAILNA